MEIRFRLWGLSHWLILVTVFVVPALLARLARGRPERARAIRWGLAAAIAIDELVWYGYSMRQGWVRFPYGLPLELCDVTLWLAVASLFTLVPTCFELAFYGALAGSLMALLTPDLTAALASYPGIQFFTAHGSVVAAVLFLAWANLARPRPGSQWRALGYLNGYAAVMGLFDKIFDTNYLYLCHKPANPSLLDWFGHWPLYLVGSELVAVVLFNLLWVLFRPRS